MEEKKGADTLSGLRDQFQYDGALYFNTAGRSAIPRCVEEEGIKAIKYKSKPWQGEMGGNTKQTNQVRELYAQLINATGEDIAICPSTAHAMSLAAFNLKRLGILGKDMVVVILEHQFASSVCPWQAVCDEVGGVLRVVKDPIDKGQTWVDGVINALDEKVVAVVLGNVHWCNGSYIDLPHLSKHLSSMSSPPLLLIDGSQSIGAHPFDVEEIKPDFLAASVHKWMMAPYGASLMYLAKKHQKRWLPLDIHDRTLEGACSPSWDEIGAMSREGGERFPTKYEKGAKKIDAGGHPNPVVLPCLIKSLSFILDLGVQNIYSDLRKTVLKIEKAIEEGVGKGYVKVRGGGEGERGHFTGVYFVGGKGGEEERRKFNVEVREKLKEKEIYVSVRCGWVRISPYAGVGDQDVERFLKGLGEAVEEVAKEMGLE